MVGVSGGVFCGFVFHNFLAADLFHEVHAFVGCFGNVVWLVVKEYFSHHHSVLTQNLGKLSGVNACNSGHVFAFEPFCQTLFCVPV